MGVFLWFAMQLQGGGRASRFSRSSARRARGAPDVRFADVAGVDEAGAEHRGDLGVGRRHDEFEVHAVRLGEAAFLGEEQAHVAEAGPMGRVQSGSRDTEPARPEQLDVARDIAAQIAGGSRSVFGLMIESHLNAGAQKFSPGKDLPSALEYGKSITDACLGWGDSLQALDVLSEAVKTRRSR